MPLTAQNINPPASATDFLEFDAWDDSGATESGWELTLSIRLGGTSDPVLVFDEETETFQGRFARYSTRTGDGTVAVPYHFRVRPDRGWPAGATTTIKPRLRFNKRAVPADEGYWQFRLHATEAQTFVDAMIANPGAYAARFSDVRVVALNTFPDQPTNVAVMVDVATKCNANNIPLTIGLLPLRVPTTYAAGVGSASFWTTQAGYVTALLVALAVFDHSVYLDLDMETYGMGSTSITEALVLANSDTLAALRARMAPFTAAVVATGLVPWAYPADPDDVLIPIICDATQVAVVVDEATFYSERTQKLDPNGYLRSLGYNGIFTRRAAILNACRAGGANVECVSFQFDDVLRKCGADFRANFSEITPRRGSLLKYTGTDFANIGLTSWPKATGLTSGAANDVKYMWPMPNQGQGDISRSLGSGASLIMQSYHAKLDALAIAPLPLKLYDEGGVMFDAPGGGFTHGMYYLPTAMTGLGQNFAVLLWVKLKASLATDAYIMGNYLYNGGRWQVVYNFALDRFELWLNYSGTWNKTTILSSPTRDVEYPIFVGRNGATAWIVSGAAAATPTRFTAGATVGSAETYLCIGSAQDTAFATPTTLRQKGNVNTVVFTKNLLVWSYGSHSDANIQSQQGGTWPRGLAV